MGLLFCGVGFFSWGGEGWGFFLFLFLKVKEGKIIMSKVNPKLEKLMSCHSPSRRAVRSSGIQKDKFSNWQVSTSLYN